MKALWSFGLTVLFIWLAGSPPDKYQEWHSQYEWREEGDTAALHIINRIIYAAKREGNLPELFYAYYDAVYFSTENKLEYADKAIYTAVQLKDDDKLASALLLKGSVFYFNYRDYSRALEEYIRAHKFSARTKNDYLKNKITYHLGVVKSYLGQYESALQHFEENEAYFKEAMQKATAPELKFNYTKGYLNSLHQKMLCWAHLGEEDKLRANLQTAWDALPAGSDFDIERAYLWKTSAWLLYAEQRYSEALSHFEEALPALVKNKDFAWVSFVYFYQAKIFLELDRPDKSLEYFTKVDSIFRKEQFLFPELGESYKFILSHYKNVNDQQSFLDYQTQYSVFLENIGRDYAEIPHNLYYNIDDKQSSNFNEKIKILPWGTALLLLFLCLGVDRRYAKILTKQLSGLPEISGMVANFHGLNKEQASYKEIVQALRRFEEERRFTSKDMSLPKLALFCKSNTSYVSQVIRQEKNKTFSQYLNSLRINYLKATLVEKGAKLRHYSVKGLAEYCGYKSAQTFSKNFKEYTGLHPRDFIEQLT